MYALDRGFKLIKVQIYLARTIVTSRIPFGEIKTSESTVHITIECILFRARDELVCPEHIYIADIIYAALI